jgi:hypothetical protein
MDVRRLSWLVLIGCLFVAPATTAWAAESACVKCHTDEATLKTLFTPPTLPDAEGEG